jgi:protein phosphatase
MRAIAAGVTDVGKERDHNEDRFVLLPEFEVYVVADGMGGHQCGEVASRMATSTIASYFRARRERGSNSAIPDVLRLALEEANDKIHTRATRSSGHRGMGTTVVAAAFSRSDEALHIAHAGDSRCYRLRDGEMSQITRDHSLVEEALRTRPDITRSELAYLPGNVITRALGVESTVDVEVATERVRLGDLYLLCSDGLHGFVDDDRIREIIIDSGVLTSTCAALIEEANKNGGGDNITAVIVRIEEADDPWARSTSVPPPPSQRMPSVHPIPEGEIVVDEISLADGDLRALTEAAAVLEAEADREYAEDDDAEDDDAEDDDAEDDDAEDDDAEDDDAEDDDADAATSDAAADSDPPIDDEDATQPMSFDELPLDDLDDEDD